MAKLGIQQKNVADIPEMSDFSPLPAGDYTCMVVESEVKDTSKGGKMLVLQMEVQDGEYQGRKLFERLNIENDNQETVDIAFKALGALCRAIGLKETPTDSDQLHNKRFVAAVGVRPAKPYDKTDPETGAVTKMPGSPQNNIKKYLPLGGVTVAVKAATAATADKPATPAAPKAKGKTPPWKEKK